MRTKLLMMTLPLTAMLGMSCQQSSTPAAPAPAAGAPQGGTVTGAITYEGWVSGFLTTNCTSCHKTGGTSPDLSTFAGASAAATKSMSDMQGGTMPQSPAPHIAQAQLDKFQAWITGGLVQTAPAANTPVVPGAVAPGPTGPVAPYYTNGWVAQYLTTNCTSCHAPNGSPLATPDLSTYAAAQAAGQSIVDAMKNNMPQSPAAKATDAQIAQMQQWITNGEPQNAPAGTTPVTGGSGPTGAVPAGVTVTYANGVSQLLSTSCLSCHGAGTQYDLSTVDKARSYADLIADDVQTGRMPKNGSLSSGDAQTFVNWVNSGSY